MRKDFVCIISCALIFFTSGCDKTAYMESINQVTTSQTVRSEYTVDNNSTKNTNGIPAIDDKVLIDRLDKTTDDSINYVYKLSPDNITVGDKYEGDFTDSGKPELMVIFKLLGMPHAGGLDCSVAAVYDRQSLSIISQKTFPTDECRFTVWKDENGMGYLAFAGTTTYQGHSAYTFQVFKPGTVWEQILPQDNSIYSNQNMKFELMPGEMVRVYQPIYKTDGSGEEPELRKKYYLKWNSSDCKLENYIPGNWLGEDGKACFDADSVSPDGRYALVSHEWGIDEGAYVILYDIKNNRYINRYDMLAKEFGFKWSPDSSRVCVTRVARIWMDLSFIDIKANKATDFIYPQDMVKKFQALGAKFSYKFNENRPDPVYTLLEWSPDSEKVLVFYQWYDTGMSLQSGTFVYNLINHSVSGLVQNKPDEVDHKEPQKPNAFKW